jgi:hypothetical protein
VLILLLACADEPPAAPPLPYEQQTITEKMLVRAFPSDRVKDREGWARDLYDVFAKDAIPATIGNACAAVAATEQESGYVADPAVPGIGGMIDEWITEKQATMGKLPAWAFGQTLRAVLDAKGPGQQRSYYDRLKAAHTERDVDVVFRAFLDDQRAKLPKALQVAESAVEVVADPDDFNPITTAGCMQVKVSFAEEHARTHRTEVSTVRDSLYTRDGCLHYGVVRLLDWEAGYDSPTFRFADYNSGFYSSRNAAFQAQVAAVTGKTLALDGDLLRYEGGRPSSTPSQTLEAVLGAAQSLGLAEGRIRKDLAKEKDRDFEKTDTWTAVRAAYQKKTGKEPAYARLPDVHLDSIKLSGDKTTAWFATSVKKRYDSCLARVKKG